MDNNIIHGWMFFLILLNIFDPKRVHSAGLNGGEAPLCVYLESERGSELLLPELQRAHLRGQGLHRGRQACVFILWKEKKN